MTPDNQALRITIREALTARQGGTVTVLSSLLAVEDAIGYIPPEAIEEVAEFTKSTVNDVWGVASFYTNFRFTPAGNHIIEVCWGPSCHFRGATGIIKEVMDLLGLADEGEPPDMDITFKYNTCLGACAQAPVISVDHQLMGRATPEEARRRVTELRNGHVGSTPIE